ncbi:MAG: hypothetical protein KDI88_01175 [Gammaproteobacteria bacterium]|nr:hypothetical protein [Gammaproteobacteria bacterium]
MSRRHRDLTHRVAVYLSGLAACILLAFGVATAKAQRQVLTFSGAVNVAPSDRLVVTGNNRDDGPRIIVIRIDDRDGPTYADRVNIERVIPPGPFELSVPLLGLRTPGGRLLDVEGLRQVICFAGESGANVEIDEPLITRSAGLPDGAVGWDLGPPGSALWPGFQRLDESFDGLEGQSLRASDRGGRQAAVEGLTTDGLRGIERLRLPLPGGTWFVTLWIQDRGEWEYLPHPLKRTISANGQSVFTRQHTASSWIEQVYLAGREREYDGAADAWGLFGEQPGGRISFVVNVGADGLTLDFEGDMPEAGYLSAVLAESYADYRARDQVEADRARWWRENWRVSGNAEPAHAGGLVVQRSNRVAARATTTTLGFELHTGGHHSVPIVRLEPPSQQGNPLPATLRWAQWRLRRSSLQSTLLVPVQRHLRGDRPPPPAPAGFARLLVVQVDVPDYAPAGRYEGALSVQLDDVEYRKPFGVTVPDVRLPAADRPVGVYLERPVHLAWFEGLGDAAASAWRCDLDQLRRLGLSGVSPGLITPGSTTNEQLLVNEVDAVAAVGFMPPFLAYAPVKRLLESVGLENTVEVMARLSEQTTLQDQSSIAWSIADEPSNAGRDEPLSRVSRYSRAYAPSAILAAHLNDPGDRRFLDDLDIALVNDGFGVDADDIQSIRKQGVTPWLYNLRNWRAASGFYLWRVGAAGYLQWHARMPTADPFDPTDGREDDVQFLFPAATSCPDVADLDVRLFDIVEGITDLRWLLWLEQAARTGRPAAALLDELREAVPGRWSGVEKLDDAQFDAWRERIVRLATPAAGQ